MLTAFPLKSLLLALTTLMAADVALDDISQPVRDIETVEAYPSELSTTAAITVRATGRVATLGWTGADLERVRANRGRLVVRMTAIPPQGPAGQMMASITAARTFRLGPGQAIREVRVMGADGGQTVEVAPMPSRP